MSLGTTIARAALSRPPRQRYGPHPSQVADLHVPPGDGPFPVALVIHGGHWRTKWGKLVTRPIAADLATRGIAAVNLEYRRLGGGGGWPQTFDDVAGAAAMLHDLGDTRLALDRLAAVGHSAGGQLALWAAGRAESAITRVAALAPVTNLAAAGAVAAELLGGSPTQVPERFAEADPIRRAPLDVPVLIVHARDDATIPIRRSREYAAAAGDGVTLVETANGGHRAPIFPPSGAWRTAADWLAETL